MHRLLTSWAIALGAAVLFVACARQPAGLAPPEGGGSPLGTPLPAAVLLPTVTPRPTEPPIEATLDPHDSEAWARYADTTGVSYEYLKDWELYVVESPYTPPEEVVVKLHPRPEGTPTLGVDAWKAGTIIRTYVGTDELVADDAFPFNFPPNEGGYRVHFPMQLQVEGATKAWLYVWGDVYTIGPTGDAEWSYGAPMLTAVIYNDTCQHSARFDAVFDPVLTEEALTMRLDQVVAKHMPWLDHIIRSTRFPPECTGAAQMPSPLATPAPP